jgi:hypothetical protein
MQHLFVLLLIVLLLGLGPGGAGGGCWRLEAATAAAAPNDV